MHPLSCSSLSSHLLLPDALLTATCPPLRRPAPSLSATFPGHLPPSSSFLHFPSFSLSSIHFFLSWPPFPLSTATIAVANIALLSDYHPPPITVLLRLDRPLTTVALSSSRVSSSLGFLIFTATIALPPTTNWCPPFLPSTLSPSRAVKAPLSLTSPVSPFPLRASSSPNSPLPLVFAAIVVADVDLLFDHRPRLITILLRPDCTLTTAVLSSSRVLSPPSFLISIAGDNVTTCQCPPFWPSLVVIIRNSRSTPLAELLTGSFSHRVFARYT